MSPLLSRPTCQCPTFDKWPLVLCRVLLRQRSRLSFSSLPIDQHLLGAINWILTAKQHSHDGGIPAFFDVLRGRWAPSYPETTGYTIPTLFACATYLGRSDLRDIAIKLADYLLCVRTPEGAVGHWKLGDDGAKAPVVFDTGQVIFGWLAAWRETSRSEYLQAAVEAANWLVAVQDESGAWVRHQHLDIVKVIDTRVAWALLELSQISSSQSFFKAAVRNLDWALVQQQSNGWFRHAAFLPSQDPFTHTIAYVAEGLMEAGLLLDEARYITAAEKVARILLEQQAQDGSLASTFNTSWQPTSRSSCLTGNCQMALLWLKLFKITTDVSYLNAAQRAITFVASTQDLCVSNVCVYGGIAGSYPIYGRYQRFSYPNWAAKFFIDALLAVQGYKLPPG